MVNFFVRVMRVVWILSLILAALLCIWVDYHVMEIAYEIGSNTDIVFLGLIITVSTWAAVLTIIQYLVLGTLDPHKLFNSTYNKDKE